SMARGEEVIATTRRPERAAELRARGIEAVVVPVLGSAVAPWVDAETHAVVTFPPDGPTDERLAEALDAAFAITVVSSTAVYGDTVEQIDDRTSVSPAPADRARRRLAAEALYRARGATVLRCPAIYGPDRGLHVRVARGQH